MVEIRHTLVISADPETIYRALTTAEGLSSWWTPGAQAIPKVGTIASFPFQEGYTKQMEVVELKTNEFVGWHCVHGDKEWIDTLLTFTLLQHDTSMSTTYPEVRDQLQQSRAGSRTLVLFEHKHWDTYSSSFAECSYTWALFLRSLKLYCETGKGTPWPTQHQTY